MRLARQPGHAFASPLLARGRLAALASGIILIASGIVVASCSGPGKRDPFAGKGSPMYTKPGAIPKGGGRRHVGKPYVIAGRRFYPRADPTYDRKGLASWYGPKFHRRMTANGEWFDMEYPSAAHPTMELPSYAKVTNLENGRQLVVRVNDRGPFVGTRIIDLSKKSAEILGTKGKGIGKVRVQYLGPAPLNDRGTHLALMNRKLRNGSLGSRAYAAATPSPKSSFSASYAAASAASAASLQPQTVSAAGEPYFIQIGSYRERANADRARHRLAGLGPVVIAPVTVSSGTYYRVKLGPLPSRRDAERARARVADYGHVDARIEPASY